MLVFEGKVQKSGCGLSRHSVEQRERGHAALFGRAPESKCGLFSDLFFGIAKDQGRSTRPPPAVDFEDIFSGVKAGLPAPCADSGHPRIGIAVRGTGSPTREADPSGTAEEKTRNGI
jgi:hypothetical protein